MYCVLSWYTNWLLYYIAFYYNFIYATSYPVHCYSSIVVLCTHCLCSTPYVILPFIRSLSDDPGFAHPNMRCFIFLTRCWWVVRLARSLEFFSVVYRYTFLSCIPVIFWFYIYQIQLSFLCCILLLSCVDIYMCYCSNIDLS